MDYQTPGVYIREIDSGPKPISSVATSIPGFLGLFEFAPKPDAIAISGSDGVTQITGKLTPQLVDKSGKFKGDLNEGATQLTQFLGLKCGNVKNVKKYFEVFDIFISGKGGATFTKDDKKKTTKVSYKSQTVEVPQIVLDI
jgi:hypothetical protein